MIEMSVIKGGKVWYINVAGVVDFCMNKKYKLKWSVLLSF